jgi:hypothetical protein
MPGFDSGSTMYALNVDFTGNSLTAGTPQVTVNGQLLIGSGALPNIKVGTLTSPNGTIQIGYSSPNITLDTTGGQAATKFTVQTTTATGVNPVVPDATGNVTVSSGQFATGTFGTRVVTINSPAPNEFDIDLQISSAVASTLITKNGICHFNSADFTVDANGFVSSNGNTVNWQTITANQTLVKNNGYMCISAGGNLSLALPTTASSTIGDIIEVTLDGATSWTITQAASQQIRFSGSQTTAGTGGSLASTAVGDTIKLVYQATGRWNVISSIGNLTVT